MQHIDFEKNKWVEWITKPSVRTIGFLGVILLPCVLFALLCIEGFSGFSNIQYINISFNLMGMVLLIILYGSSNLDANASSLSSSYFRVVLELNSIVLFLATCVMIFSVVPGLKPYLNLLSLLYGLFFILETIAYWYYCLAHFSATTSKYRFLGTGLIVLSILGFALMVWFVISSPEESLKYSNIVTSVLPGASLIPLVILVYSRILSIFVATEQLVTRREKAIFMFCPLVPIVIALLEFTVPGLAIADSAIVVSLIIVYGQVSIKRSETLAQKEKELTNQRVALMVSQIQPHFMFNALNTICYLCRKDPRAAERATAQFAQYIRVNIDSLSNMEMIPFSKELEHVKTYIELEQLRFGDKLSIVYDIGVNDFRLPPLSMQPLVENAVKHGLCEKDKGGLIKISTVQDGGYYVIKILDNGVGFDQSKAPNDNKVHVGVSNVGERLHNMCGGSLDIYSIPGTGTLATIKIPVKED